MIKEGRFITAPFVSFRHLPLSYKNYVNVSELLFQDIPPLTFKNVLITVWWNWRTIETRKRGKK
jgi:hypothetical protein